MATEAARLKRQNLLIRKRKTDLTLTGLLMEGVGRLMTWIVVCSSVMKNLSRKGRGTRRTSYDPIESGLICRQARMKLVNGRGWK